MTCIFFGHKDAPDGIKEQLRCEILRMIEENGVKTFYVGNNGRFDAKVQGELERIVNARNDVVYYIAVSRIGEKAINGHQERTLLVEEVELALPRFAIAKRNYWLVKQAQFAIVYLAHCASNCRQWVEKAQRRGVTVVNLADNQDLGPCI